MKEAIFNILGPLEGALALDLYAGTGSLGIEALSRGAELAVFVESARDGQRVLRENVEALHLEARALVLAADVARATDRISKSGPFDVIFADPPYRELEAAMPAIEAAASALAEEGVVVIEHAARDTPKPSKLEAFDTRRYGDTAVTFLRRSAQALG